MKELRDTFYDDFHYGILYINYRGLSIDIYKTKEEMDKAYEEFKDVFKYIKKIEIGDVEKYNKLYELVDRLFYDISTQWEDGFSTKELDEFTNDLREFMYKQSVQSESNMIL